MVNDLNAELLCSDIVHEEGEAFLPGRVFGGINHLREEATSDRLPRSDSRDLNQEAEELPCSSGRPRRRQAPRRSQEWRSSWSATRQGNKAD